MRVGIRDRSIEGMVGAADRMAWKRCCCCRVSSLWRVLAVSWAVLGAYAISLTIYYNPTWDTLSWDTSNVKVDLSPRQNLRFRSRGNSTTSAQNIYSTQYQPRWSWCGVCWGCSPAAATCWPPSVTTRSCCCLSWPGSPWSLPSPSTPSPAA